MHFNEEFKNQIHFFCLFLVLKINSNIICPGVPYPTEFARLLSGIESGKLRAGDDADPENRSPKQHLKTQPKEPSLRPEQPHNRQSTPNNVSSQNLI